ncbi:hypothetical protein HFD88_008958 [Aspergillus terreus]|nr:hypothetical protein HFD88_008958 [Aspergillus terreus]
MQFLRPVGLAAFSRMSDLEAIHLFGKVFPSELSHLKNACPTVESTGGMMSLGSLGTDGNLTPSTVLFGVNFAEVNRTLVSMLALRWLFANDYETFTTGQDSSHRLTETSFQRLREFFIHRVQTTEDLQTLLIAVIVDDIGKDPGLGEETKKKTGDNHDADHSEVVFHAARAGVITAVNQMGSDSHRNDLFACLRIGSSLNISQVAQGESPAGSLATLSHLQDHERGGFNLRVMVTFLDVAGAAGHIDTRGCVVMTETVFQTYETTITALVGLADGRIPSPRACYDRILGARAQFLHQQGFVLLSPTAENDEERALLRLLCMGRVSSPKEARTFRLAFDRMPSSNKKALVDGLVVDGIDDGVAIIPYYAPGLLAEALRNTVDQSEESITRALTAFMRFLSLVLADAKPQPGTPGTVVARDLSFVQDVIKGNSFRERPEILETIVLPWK